MKWNPKHGWPGLALGRALLTAQRFAADLGNRAEPDWWLTPRPMIQTRLRETDAGTDVAAYVASLKAAGANVVLFNVGGSGRIIPSRKATASRRTSRNGRPTK
jgi:hypothetical protein